MSLTTEVRSAVSLLERLQGSLRGCDEPRMGVQCTNDLNTLISVLHNPVLNKIVTIQDSLHDLKRELARHPSLLPSDFTISSRRGDLTLHFPTDEDQIELYPHTERASFEVTSEQQVHSPLDLVNVEGSLLNSFGRSSHEDSTPPSPQTQWLKNGQIGEGDSEGEGLEDDDDGVHEGDYDDDGGGLIPQSLGNDSLDAELWKLVRVAAEGRQIHHIQLYKPEGTSLGFSVVGLKSEQRGDLGIYVQEIQPTGIAAKDGRLQDGDQILAIDGQLLDSYISHQQAIGILQKANKLVDLVVARAPSFESQQALEEPKCGQDQFLFKQHPQHYSTTHIVPPSTESRTSNMLNTEWAQVEVIHLVNDGSGLGFGIIGGRSTGVVVKTILPGGVADREGRLRSGDHILQIGEVNLRGMGSDQVASVLRQAGSHVRLVVARPVESASPDFQIGRNAPIVETRVLNDPDELDRHLNLISNGFPSSSIALTSVMGGNGCLASSSTSSASTVPVGAPANGHSDYINGDSELLTANNPIASTSGAMAVVAASDGPLPPGGPPLPSEVIPLVEEGGEGMSLADLPEMETVDLDLAKDHHGLGITIAGYVCEREELSGIFVKSINVGSAADRSGQVQVNDQIVEVDGKSLTGLSNHAAVEVLRSTGQRVRLRLARYLRGPKFEQLQQAIANSELKTTPTTPNPPRAPLGDVPSSDAIRTALDELGVADIASSSSRSRESLMESSPAALSPSAALPLLPKPAPQPHLHHTSVITIKDTFDPSTLSNISPTDVLAGVPKSTSDIRLDDIELLIDSDYTGELMTPVESAIMRKWSRIIGPDFDIVVAQLKKFERGGGLGISLEGTVDVEDGREVRPHHYIRSILPDGPVGRDGRLRSGDELLEVNNQKLLGLNHVEVVTILKELPQAVRIICGRRVSGSTTPLPLVDAGAGGEPLGPRDVLGGSLQNLIPSSERLVKAKSDGSLASSSTTNVNSDSGSFTKVKSRSLEPLTGLAMWSTEPQHIELMKGEGGLGFSILDYQDPLNPQETVIVIRSLVPGRVAEKDGRLIPGDRLVGVNGVSLEKASLDEAVAVLKGAPKGPVIISVAKPISVLESPGQLDLILGDLGSSEAGSDVTDAADGAKLDDDLTQIEERRKRRKTNDSIISSTSSGPPALPSTEPPSLERDASVLMVPVATERLIGGSTSSSSASTSNSAVPSSEDEEASPRGSPIPQPRITSLTSPLPKKLERLIKVRKGGDQLGVNIEVVDQGLNGVVVSSLVRGGAVHKDGRIHAGDLVVSVNNESMRNITNSQARAILRRTQLVSTDVSIAYIPGQEAAKYRESLLQNFQPDFAYGSQKQLSPRSHFIREESSGEEQLGVAGDLTRSSTAPSFITKQLRSRDSSREEAVEAHLSEVQLVSPPEPGPEGRSASSLSDVSGAAATVVTLKNAISEVLGTEDRSRVQAKSDRDENEEGPFTITFRNVTEAGVVRGEFQPSAEECLQSSTGLGGGVDGSDLRIARFEPVQLTDALYNQFFSSSNNTSFDSSYIPTAYAPQSSLSNLPSSEAFPPGVSAHSRLVRFSDSKSGSSDSSLLVECGDSDRHSASDIPFFEDSFSSEGKQFVDEHYSGAKLVVAHIADVASLVQKRALPSSRSFDETPASRGLSKAPRLRKQHSEVIPNYTYYDSDYHLRPSTRYSQPGQLEQSSPAEIVKRRFLYSEDYIPESTYQDLLDPDQNYPVFPEDSHPNTFLTSPTTTITSSSTAAELQLASSNLGSGSATRQTGIEMTVAQAMGDSGVEGRDGTSATPPLMDGKHWGPQRTVDVRRDENGSLGISIVGGKVDLNWSGSTVTGIFVKNVLVNSPAGRSGLLKTGDRILEVEGVDLRNASHEKAVEVIKRTGNPVTFMVQSLVQWSTTSVPPSRDASRLGSHIPDCISPARTPTPELIQPGLSDQTKQEMQEKMQEKLAEKEQIQNVVADATTRQEDSEEGESSSDEEDTRTLQGRTTSSQGVEIDRASAGAMKLLKNETEVEEDEFGYTKNKVQRKYGGTGGEIVIVDLQKGTSGLGISLAGHKDRTQMSVYVCGLNPNGIAFKDGRVQVGDEVLEVNGYVLEGRSHLNASAIFKGIAGVSVKIIVRRKKSGLQDMAVAPLTQFPVSLEEESQEEKYARFKGLTNFVMKKGQSGLGIMIIEGKHAEYGNGIFISDLQEGSTAAEAGLMVGDMILSVNKEEMVGIDYEMAANILKKTEGVINMWVANATRVAGSTPSPGDAAAPGKTAPPTPAKNVEPKKPEEPAAPPSTAEIKPGKETTIEIVKEKMGLGLSIVGGTDTLLGAIIIHEVYPDGAAAKDGRLKPGDQILEVNNENFRVITHQKALSVLRQTPSKVKMVVYREEGTQKEEDMYDVISVQLTKKSGKGLGLSIVGRKNGPGVFISDLVSGGVAENDGRLMQGDQILEVNDKDLRTATQEQAAAILKCAPASVSMKIGRLKAGKKVSQGANPTTWPVTIHEGPSRAPPSSLSPEFSFPHPPLLLSSHAISPLQPSPSQQPSSPPPPPPPPISHGGPPPQTSPPPLRPVVLERGDDGLGFSIVGGFGSNLGDLPIYVKSVFDRGAAAHEGSLRRGDQILQVNGHSLAGLTHAQAVGILKDAKGTVTLTILPSK